MTILRAATHASSSQYSPPTWHVVETANFRILAYGQAPVDAGVARSLELLRTSLAERWHAPATETAWSPKCQVVLHPSEASYLAEVGSGARSTVASSLVRRQNDRIALRRIDVKPLSPHARHSAFGHELAHLVLADRFVHTATPHWVDEGVAILADARDKQLRHAADFQHALERGNEFRFVELVALGDYPPAGRWGTFYGQSASLVRFLVDRGDERQFLTFVEQAMAVGYGEALRDVYGLEISELERHWRADSRQARSVPATRLAGRS